MQLSTQNLKKKKPPFALRYFRAWNQAYIEKLGRPNSNEWFINLTNEWSIPYGKELRKLLEQFDIEERFLHNRYGLVFYRNNGEWECTINMEVLELVQTYENR